MRHLESKNKKQLPALGLKEPGKEIIFSKSLRDRTGEKRCLTTAVIMEGCGNCRNTDSKAERKKEKNTPTFLSVLPPFSS